MTYRRSSEQGPATRAWARFLEANRGLLAASALPAATVASESHFADLLMHGHLDHHPDPAHFGVQSLSAAQYQGLVQLADSYFAAGHAWFTPTGLKQPDQAKLRAKFGPR